MKLIGYKYLHDYEFSLLFENNEKVIADLAPLISAKLSKDELNSAHMDREWGCLEFKDGLIDIEPNTLYKFCVKP